MTTETVELPELPEQTLKLPVHHAATIQNAISCAEREPHKLVAIEGRALLALVDAAQMAVLAERERCAKVCEDIYDDPDGNNGYDAYYTRPYLECAEAIRKG